jgi:(1->4)-alpha-D-glucan 1-alpha-D-glucosylmutase
MIEAGPAACQSPARIPGSTYRLQLNREFTFHQAREISEYLQELGITDCYASPIFTARPGSAHGYDICDWSEINPELGGAVGFEAWSARLRELGLGLLLDVVPNHMSADPANPWWQDVLEKGAASPYAEWFDIDWDSTIPGLKGRVLLPLLEDHYSTLLESGVIRLAWESGRLAVIYREKALPVCLEACRWLEARLDPTNRYTAANVGRDELWHEARHWARRPGYAWAGEVNEPAEARDSLGPERGPSAPLETAVQALNGIVGVPASFDDLDALLRRQHYQLAHWRLGSEAINYRRFFDVSELVAMRIELMEVFSATHGLLFRLLQQGKVTGLRIDHPDGLWDPAQYLHRLQQGFSALPDREGSRDRLYVVVEKILSHDEVLPADWPVAGTTGYDFLNLANSLFVDPSRGAAFDGLYKEFRGPGLDFDAIVYRGKQKILQTSLRGDLRSLARRLGAIASQTRYGIDFSPSQIEDALRAVVAAFPVYRTYVTEGSAAPSAQERAAIQKAMQIARQSGEPHDPGIFDLIEKLLLLDPPSDLDATVRPQCRHFALHFQQMTGPVMAKGLEDTAFYAYNRFISLNEVGGAPEVFGTDLETFHDRNGQRARDWPHTLLATTTHDTKRGEDLRARLNVLSEMSEEWRQVVLKWRRLNHEIKPGAGGRPAPDDNDEYFLYQTLVGAWTPEAASPAGLDAFLHRISAYWRKAIREAKINSSWSEPDLPYENGCEQFARALLTPGPHNSFLDDFMLFHRKVAFFGLFNSLAQVVLKLTVPGVPDFYQGTELWDYSLVDPDNRRAVNYDTRKHLLRTLRERFPRDPGEMGPFVRGLLRNYPTGQIKMFLIWRILDFRSQQRPLFDEGNYEPIYAPGRKRDHVCAFARETAAGAMIVVVTRLLCRLAGGSERTALDSGTWGETTLPLTGGNPGSRYRNVLTGQLLPVREPAGGLVLRDVLALLPVAVLERIN